LVSNDSFFIQRANLWCDDFSTCLPRGILGGGLKSLYQLHDHNLSINPAKSNCSRRSINLYNVIGTKAEVFYFDKLFLLGVTIALRIESQQYFCIWQFYLPQ
jgi:hypothetical protein